GWRNAGGPGAGPVAWTLLRRDPDLASRGRSGRASMCGARESNPSAAGTGRFQSAMSRSLPRSIFRVTFLVLATASAAWARCGVSHHLADLEARPRKCGRKPLVALQPALANRLEFRESLDLPLAKKVLQERKCPSTDDLRAFVDAWKQLPGTGFSYTAKRFCLAAPT